MRIHSMEYSDIAQNPKKAIADSGLQRLVYGTVISIAAALTPVTLSGCPQINKGTPIVQSKNIEKQKEPTTKLFGGEMEIRPDGLYTFAHIYVHPKTNITVLMIGSNHGGEESYFKTIDTLLSKNDAVIYEGFVKKDRDPSQPPEKEPPSPTIPELKKMAEENIDIAYEEAAKEFFRRSAEYLKLAWEKDFINYSRKNWQSADVIFYNRLKNDKKFQESYTKRIEGAANPISKERKHEIFRFSLSALQRIEDGLFTRHDWMNAFVFFWSDDAFRTYITTLYGNPRDEVAFELFDKLQETKGIRNIGIIYGAGHLPYQRSLLIQRGFVHQQSIPLQNIALDKK